MMKMKILKKMITIKKKDKNEIDDEEIDDIFKSVKDDTKKNKKGKKEIKTGKKRNMPNL